MISAFWWGGLAAASLLIGYVLANRGLSQRMVGLVMGVGAGALLSAIAYELIPESALAGSSMAVAFGLGALAFFGGDWLVDRRGGADRKDIAAGAMLTMLADAMMPEAFEHGGKLVGLFTVFGFLIASVLSFVV